MTRGSERCVCKLAAIALCIAPLCRAQLDPDPGSLLAAHRARERVDCPRNADVATLTMLTRSRRAYRVEWAIEQLADRGSAAAAAVPVLLDLLQRPDPRVLTTASFVPIRAAAARAVLAIAPGTPAAATAEAVLDGRLAPTSPEGPVPERARHRAEQVVAELAQPPRREAAVANLVALGRVAVPPLLTALRESPDPELRNAALAVLRELGPQAVDAVPALGDLLVALPAENTTAVVRTLTATLPWTRDVLPSDMSISGRGAVRIAGHVIQGTFTTETRNELFPALQDLFSVVAIEPDLPDAIAPVLADGLVVRREAALRIIALRGPAMRSLLPALASMLEQPQPGTSRHQWLDTGELGVFPESHDEVVHRLAAQAILAVAAPDDPLVGKARTVLARTPSGGK